MLTNAKLFKEVVLLFQNWVYSETKNVILCSWGGWDIVELRKSYENHSLKYPFRGKTFDIKSIVVWISHLWGMKPNSDGLGILLKAWNVKFKGTRHRACDDAKNTALLLLETWQKHDEYKDKILKTLGHIGIK